MDKIRIRSCFTQDVTVISNDFLDRFLPEANGDFLKIYLHLLRTAGRRSDSFSLCSIADRMNCTENDVIRALRYWEKEHQLQLTLEEDGTISEIAFVSFCTPGSDPEPTVQSPSQISSERMAELGENEDIRELFFIAQQYIGHPLTRSEMQKICFFYDNLRFSADLIDYLIDYCVSRGKTSFHYMEKVAMSWKEQGINSVHEARINVGSYHREYYDILKYLGINNHHPVDAEIRLMKKWLEKYGLSMDLIRLACERTLMGTGKPTLNYVDSILTRWKQAGVTVPADVEKLDAEHTQKKKPAKSTGSPAFTDFEQRTYNYKELESRLAQM